MATYAELYNLRQEDAALQSKIVAAAQDYATTVLAEATPVAERKAWAEAVRDSPDKALDLMWAVLIANKAFTKAQISGATDASILTAVGDAVSARYGDAA